MSAEAVRATPGVYPLTVPNHFPRREGRFRAMAARHQRQARVPPLTRPSEDLRREHDPAQDAQVVGPVALQVAVVVGKALHVLGR